jgi:hypothetical protein
VKHQVPKFDAWKDTFLIVAGLGAVGMALAANYHANTALVWCTALTICASLAALHARWQTRFTRRLALLAGTITLIACGIWQYNIPKPEQPKTPAPQSYGQVLPPSDLPTFREQSDVITVTAGTNSHEIPIRGLEGRRVPFFPTSLGGGPYNPVHIGLKNGKPVVDATIWAGLDLPSVEIKQNAFTVRPLNWDSNTSKTALEVVNEKGIPVLQVYYRNAYHISICGTFPIPDGAIFVTETEVFVDKRPPIFHDMRSLKPIFKYPAWKYPGEYADNP